MHLFLSSLIIHSWRWLFWLITQEDYVGCTNRYLPWQLTLVLLNLVQDKIQRKKRQHTRTEREKNTVGY